MVVKHEQLSIQKQGVDEEIQKLQFNIGAQPEKPEPVAAEQVPAPDLDFYLKALATLINHGKLDENPPLRVFCEETLNKFHTETGRAEGGNIFETFKDELTDRCTTHEEFQKYFPKEQEVSEEDTFLKEVSALSDWLGELEVEL